MNGAFDFSSYIYSVCLKKGEIKIKSILVIGNVIFSGLVAFFISWFFAEGAIGDANSLTPEFFLILLIWAIGVLLIWKVFSSVDLESTSYFKIIFNNLLLWLTIPIGFIFSHLFI